MAQTGSAQREPSMEEILASIRRIIQDSDPTREPAAVEPEPAVAEAPALREVAAFRAELDEPSAPVAGMVEGEAEAETVVALSTPAADPVEIVAADEQDMEPEPAFDMVDETELSVRLPEDEVAAPAPESVAETESEADAATQRPAIISDHAGRQVAAAFGELSEAFAVSRRRSFDDMAQEMLRPMLQEWLDNNLPTLVERLVREEIERVARGG